MKRELILFFLLPLLVASCTTGRIGKSMVRWTKGISLAEYKAFEVIPVSNETGNTYDFDVTDLITQEIMSNLKDKGYVITEESSTEKNVIIIKSRLLAFDTGITIKQLVLADKLGTPQATVKTSLIDKRTGKVVGLIMTHEKDNRVLAGASGKLILNIAKAITKEIDNKFKEKEGEVLELTKPPIPLWQVLRHRIPDTGWVEYEDKRYEYFVDLEYIVWDKKVFGYMNAPLCPIKEVRYTVIDKESGEIIRNETFVRNEAFDGIENCAACHPK